MQLVRRNRKINVQSGKFIGEEGNKKESRKHLAIYKWNLYKTSKTVRFSWLPGKQVTATRVAIFADHRPAFSFLFGFCIPIGFVVNESYFVRDILGVRFDSLRFDCNAAQNNFGFIRCNMLFFPFDKETIEKHKQSAVNNCLGIYIYNIFVFVLCICIRFGCQYLQCTWNLINKSYLRGVGRLPDSILYVDIQKQFDCCTHIISPIDFNVCVCVLSASHLW